MAERKNVHCRSCGRHKNEAGELSWRGLCQECAILRFGENIVELRAQRGPFVDYWAYRMAASVGLAPLDDPPPRP